MNQINDKICLDSATILKTNDDLDYYLLVNGRGICVVANHVDFHVFVDEVKPYKDIHWSIDL